jgi:hypothetical protein
LGETNKRLAHVTSGPIDLATVFVTETVASQD